MTVREYIGRPDAIRQEIARKQARIAALRRLASRVSSPPQEVRVRTSPDPARTQGLLAEVVDGERELLLLEETLEQAVADTALFIAGLPDDRLIRLLELRYLEGCGWEEISGRLGYSPSRTFALHRQALSLLPPPPEDPEEGAY